MYVILALLAFALLTLLVSFLVVRVRVPEGSFAVIERLGKFHQVLPPGKHFILPLIDRNACLLAVATESETFKFPVPLESGSVIHITLRLTWTLLGTDPENITKVAYLFRDPEKRTAVIRNAVQKIVSRFFDSRTAAVTFSDFEPLIQFMRPALEDQMKTMGYQLINLQLQDLYQG